MDNEKFLKYENVKDILCFFTNLYISYIITASKFRFSLVSFNILPSQKMAGRCKILCSANQFRTMKEGIDNAKAKSNYSGMSGSGADFGAKI